MWRNRWRKAEDCSDWMRNRALKTKDFFYGRLSISVPKLYFKGKDSKQNIKSRKQLKGNFTDRI